MKSEDPQGFYDIIRQAPWHADTLLQLSELYRHREGSYSSTCSSGTKKLTFCSG